jgi:hypothetical protein
MASLVYIASDNRSGSTLLDQLLGGHPEMVSVGELRRLGAFLAPGQACTCGAPPRECEFWGPVLEGLADEEVRTDLLPRSGGQIAALAAQGAVLAAPLGLLRGARLPALGRVRERARGFWGVVDRIHAVSGARVVVDSSKNADQLKLLFEARPEAVRVIYLVRDGRGVALSKSKRVGVPFWRGAASWTASNLRLLAALRSIPAAQRLTMRYEDLCADPDRELRRATEFLGLTHDPALARLDRSGRHNIGGSPHRFTTGDVAIRLDDRWHAAVRGLTAVQFGVLGGWLNAMLGYRRR